MASTDAKPFPQKNVVYRVTFPLLDANGDLVAGAAGLDSEISKDAGTFVDCTNEATQIATSSGMYYLDLTATEMNADTVALIIKTTTTGAKTTPIVLYPEEAGDIRVNVTTLNAVAQSLLDLKDFADAGYDPTANKVQGVVLVDTTTTNSDMRGTDSAALATDVGTSGAGLTALGGMSTSMKAEILTEVQKLLTTQMTEVYAADGIAPTLSQCLFLIMQAGGEFAISGTTITAKKLDGTTTAATYTLDDSSNPTSRTRAT